VRGNSIVGPCMQRDFRIGCVSHAASRNELRQFAALESKRAGMRRAQYAPHVESSQPHSGCTFTLVRPKNELRFKGSGEP
jgi:hypothetical protein